VIAEIGDGDFAERHGVLAGSEQRCVREGRRAKSRHPNNRPNTWEFLPSFRMAERAVCGVKGEEWRKSAIFRVWHALCRVVCVPRMAGENGKTHQGVHTMFATNFADRFLAAAVSIVISAALLAYAIVPATPALIA
jgi:hypothetical protein